MKLTLFDTIVCFEETQCLRNALPRNIINVNLPSEKMVSAQQGMLLNSNKPFQTSMWWCSEVDETSILLKNTIHSGKQISFPDEIKQY